MCGVFGIHGHDEAANIAYLGLHALQHRGQESAGLVAALRARSTARRHGPGLGRLRSGRLGPAARAHRRSATSATRRPAARCRSNAQPLTCSSTPAGRSPSPTTATSSTHERLRERLEAQGAIFQTSSDTEVIVHLHGAQPARPTSSSSACCDALGAGAGRVLARGRSPTTKLIGRPRPARLPPAGARPLRQARVLRRRVRDLRLRSDRGRVRPRHRARRDPRHRARAACAASSCAASTRRASACSSTSTSPAPTACSTASRVYEARIAMGEQRWRARSPGRGRRRRARCPTAASSRRSGSRKASGHPVRDGPHPQPLRRPHLHRAAGLDPPLRRRASS